MMGFFQNDGMGYFIDVIVEVGFDILFYGMGVVIGDYDNDGWCDIFLIVVGKNWLL